MERLQKAMAEAGVASRRASEESFILQGKVAVIGKIYCRLNLALKLAFHDKIIVNGVQSMSRTARLLLVK